MPRLQFFRNLISDFSFALLVTAIAIGSGLMAAFGLSSAVNAAPVTLEADLGQKVVSKKGGKIYLRLSLRALQVDRREEERTPVNVALVLDRSGSMKGKRLASAKEAARMALSRLGRSDFVSLVAYNHDVDVLSRSSRVSNHDSLDELIDSLVANGTTALYAGVKEGGRQVKRNYSDRRVNRVILMSDGLANVGPSSPGALADLGQELGSKGISVTTIGLGLSYNEDLMSRLALASDGNHAFAKTPDDLVDIFNSEFGDTLSIAAQDIEIIIECRDGYKPKRVLGRKAEIDGSRARVKLNQLTGGAERYLIVELEAPSGVSVNASDVADVEVKYLDLDSGAREAASRSVKATYSEDDTQVEASLNKSVMSQVTAQIATENSERAVELRDRGDIAGARQALQDNAAYIKKNRQLLGAGEGAAPAASIGVLDSLASESQEAAANLDGDAWKAQRKAMRYQQHKAKRQQSY